MLKKGKRFMNVTAVSAIKNNRSNCCVKKTEENNPSFKGVYLKGLKQNDILSLYEDGPAIWRMIQTVTPQLKEKYPMFHTIIEVGRDYFRGISVSFMRNKAYDNQLKNYIVQKNSSSFQFPQFVVDSFRAGSDDFAGFLDGKNFRAIKMRFGNLGEQQATQRFMQFIRSRDQDFLIRKMYEIDAPKITA